MTVTATRTDKFIQWAKSKGVHINPNITIKESPLGGMGVFLNLSALTAATNNPITEEDSIELIRVPHSLKLSLDSISQNLLAPQVKYDRGGYGDYLKQSVVFTTFLTQFQTAFEDHIDPLVRSGLNETNILVGQLQILTVLKFVRERLLAQEGLSADYKKFLEDSPFAQFDPYLDLLYSTDVALIKTDEYYDDFDNVYKYHQRTHRIEIEKVKNAVVWKALESIDEDLGFDPKSLADESVLKRVEASVISRILEIPEELKPSPKLKPNQGRFDKFDEQADFRKALRKEVIEFFNDEEEADKEEPVGQGRYDRANDRGTTDFRKAYTKKEEHDREFEFAVASTLVPVIDFINHSNDSVNCSFDVDRINKDVILKLDGAKVKGLNGEIELFITYDEVEDAFKFAHTYGFLPKSQLTPVLFEHQVDRAFLKNHIIKTKDADGHSLGVALKWFGIQPSVQFVTHFDSNGTLKDVFLNLDENYFPFAFVKKIKYVPDRAQAIFKEIVTEDDEGEIPEDFIKDLITLQESILNDVIEGCGLTPFVTEGLDEAENLDSNYLLESATEDEVDEYIAEFIDFLIEYFPLRLKELDDFLEKHSNKDSTIVQLARFEKEVLQKFIEKTSNFNTVHDKVEYLVLGDGDLNEEWVKNRMRPIMIPQSAKLKLQEKYALEALRELTLGRAEENDVTFDDK